MGQGMCVSSRLPPGEVDSSPDEYKPPLTPPRPGRAAKKKLKLKQLPVKVRVFLKSPNKPSLSEDNLSRPAGLSAAAEGTTSQSQISCSPTAADVIPGVVQRLQLTHQRSQEKTDPKLPDERAHDDLARNEAESSNKNEGGRPRTRSFSLRTEKKRLVSTSSESDASSPAAETTTTKSLSPRTRRTSRTITKDPKVGLNIVKETTILHDGDEEDAPMAQLDELKQFYSFEGILEIKYTKIIRSRTDGISEPGSPGVPYKYTKTTVTTSRNCSPSVSPRNLSPSNTPMNRSPQPSRPVTPTQTSGTQTTAEEPYMTASVSTPTRLAVPKNFYCSELDSDSDTQIDTDSGDSSTLSTSDDASVEYVPLLSPDFSDNDFEDDNNAISASYQTSVRDIPFDSFSQQYDSARSMSESSSLTSVTMLPSPVSWSVPLRECDIAEDILSPCTDTDEINTLGIDTPVSSVAEKIDNNTSNAMQNLRFDSDNDSGVEHGDGRSDESVIVEEQVSKKLKEQQSHEVPRYLGVTLTEDPEQETGKKHHPPQEQSLDVSKQTTETKDDKNAPTVSLKKHQSPPFTSNRIPYIVAASSWPFRIRPASMMFQFNRRYIGRAGQGNAMMMLFGPLIYNPSFPWHEALVSLKVPRHVIKDMNAHLAICSAQQKRKTTDIRECHTEAKGPSKEIDGVDNDDGSDVDARDNIEALLVVEVQDPQSTCVSVSRGREKKKAKPKDTPSTSPGYCFTKTPPKADDKECIVL